MCSLGILRKFLGIPSFILQGSVKQALRNKLSSITTRESGWQPSRKSVNVDASELGTEKSLSSYNPVTVFDHFSQITIFLKLCNMNTNYLLQIII